MGEDDWNAHAQFAVRSVPDGMKSAFDRAGFFYHPAGVFKIRLARFRQANLLGCPIQQTGTQSGLKARKARARLMPHLEGKHYP